MSIESIIDDFAFLDEWEDRYRYVIELGRALPEMPDEERTEATKVRGCASQVWLVSEDAVKDGEAVLIFRGDSDAHIVRGLIAIVLALYSGTTPEEILKTDAEAVFARMGLREHLTAQRSNGLSAMLQRIRRDAESRLAQ
ncbi:SufE family protein [Afifella marina]|uniref:Cysteine desulfuration protein SufE n=1 Tax=Afifella marina DSM 2698 TaxID=1120955 RepID=A0A1G5MFH9_AFIMA|nr:SufE family protein [Afifella marina]MBK1625200.1 cysteine desulfuration protein SufE [Afifella marina DSM 2698]MBK1628917.1 cysteine desulfuration protein SufE [Afifella marina]MBK5918296.1 cysteine desufuration protein SufE [Afifella marina]RAI22815.1 cysteine desulfuration protein SufE [Afifella marina DSM 2698]SCZ23903.1 cysteine desulfuration protein SufE [Afifella marina DSM 2698]